MTPQEIAAMIDVSAVRADSRLDDVKASAEMAMQYGCICVFALPAHTSYLIELLADSRTFAGGVVGFPGGAETTSIKAATATELVRMGCKEIDMVNNIAWLKAGDKGAYVNDVRTVVEASAGKPVKVILECHWLTDEDISRACEWCVEAGASWVKTGTGWAPTGATLENTELMKQSVGDRCRVKAAGGVRDLETLLAMHAVGVRRFGIGVRTAAAILDEASGGVKANVVESY
ncbi:MAG: deoxyribose-phosphate aldolase [Kiritimatiellae bacterium]|jgi:deoxyribose-phosphate aldolase|nr:deoxyribose-phosphate aldolase [Kiritimatiellia bacterium]